MGLPVNTAPDLLHPSADVHQAIERPPRWYGWLALVAIGPLLLLILRLAPSLDRTVLHSPLVHVLIVGGATTLGMILALLVLYIARQAYDGRVYLVGMGFLSIASIFFVHAISTPDVLMVGRGLATAWSAMLSLVLGAALFAISALDISPAANSLLMRNARRGVLLFLVFWLAYATVFLLVVPIVGVAQPAASAEHTIVAASSSGHGAQTTTAGVSGARGSDAAAQGRAEQTSEPQLALTSFNVVDTLRFGFAILGLLCYAFAAVRHYRLYRRSPSPAGLAVVCGILLFGEALLTQQLSQVYTVSFWLYHAEEFVGFGVISYAGLGAYRRGMPQASLFEGLFLAPTRDRIQAAYAQVLDSLIEMLSRDEEPDRARLESLRRRFSMSETQVALLERAALSVAQERRQRHELEQLNSALRQVEQDKEQLIQMVVHDLKNPLTALIGFLEILRMDQLSPEQSLLLDGALRSGKNLSGLIGDLLDVGRIEEGRIELDRSSFALRELLTDCAAEMSAWLAQDGKIVSIDTQADLPQLHADQRLIRRVLLNLLSNAIKHTPSGTRIILRTRTVVQPGVGGAGQAPAALEIAVEDTGPGIPEQHLASIFEKFGRVNGAPHARQDSTGLGLTFCRLAVEAHGGTIDVSSVVGRGTTFHIVLPLY